MIYSTFIWSPILCTVQLYRVLSDDNVQSLPDTTVSLELLPYELEALPSRCGLDSRQRGHVKDLLDLI